MQPTREENEPLDEWRVYVLRPGMDPEMARYTDYRVEWSGTDRDTAYHNAEKMHGGSRHVFVKAPGEKLERWWR